MAAGLSNAHRYCTVRTLESQVRTLFQAWIFFSVLCCVVSSRAGSGLQAYDLSKKSHQISRGLVVSELILNR